MFFELQLKLTCLLLDLFKSLCVLFGLFLEKEFNF